MCTEEKLGKNNNSAHLRECFIEKERKKYKKQPFSRCRRSKSALPKLCVATL
jgi:hypothetical protein